MATWEPGKFTPKYRSRERRAFALVISALSAVTFMLVGVGTYWALRLEDEVAEAPAPTEISTPRGAPQAAQRRPIEVPQAQDRRSRVATLQTSPEPSAFAIIYLLEFGRFGNLPAAQAQAAEDTAAEKALALALEAHRLAPDLVPAAAIAGRVLASKGNTPRAARVLHEGIEGSELAVIPDSGHMSFVEQPEAYLGAVRPFLRRVAA